VSSRSQGRNMRQKNEIIENDLFEIYRFYLYDFLVHHKPSKN